jgi:hypothetical protein
MGGAKSKSGKEGGNAKDYDRVLFLPRGDDGTSSHGYG